MNKKKLGLSKNIASIFKDVPGFDVQKTESSEIPAKGRNSLIPSKKSFIQKWSHIPLWGRRVTNILDVGSDSLKLLSVKEGRSGEIEVIAAAEILFSRVQGKELFDEIEFLESIKKINQKIKGIKTVDLLVSEPEATFNILSIAKGNRSRLEQILASDMIRRNPHWNRDDHILSYVVSKRPSRELVGGLHVTTATLTREVAQGWVKAIESIGWELRSIQGIPFAIEALLQIDPSMSSEQPMAILELGNFNSMIYFFRDGLLEYIRRIPFALSEVTKALQKPIMTPEGKMELTLEEAESLILEIGFPLGQGEVQTTLGKTINHTQILSFIRPIFERLIQEIERSRRFYLRTYQLQECNQLILMGGGAQLKNLEQYFTTQLHLRKVGLLNAFELKNIKLPPDAAQLANPFSPSLGLVLQSKPGLDLRPSSLRMYHTVKLFHTWFNKAALFMALYLVLLLMIDASLLNSKKKIFENTHGDYVRLKNGMNQVEKLRSNTQQLNKNLSHFARVLGPSAYVSLMMKELSLSMMKQIYVTQLSMSHENNEWHLNIRGDVQPGQSSVDQTLSEFLIRLEKTRSFSQVNLLQSQRKGETADLGISFEVQCKILEGVILNV